MGCSSDESNVAAAITYAASRARVICIASTNIYGEWCYDDTDDEWSEEVREAIRNAY